MSDEILSFDARYANRRTLGRELAALGVERSGFGGLPLGGPAYGSPDYADVTPQGLVPGPWARALEPRDLEVIQQSGGNVVFTLDGAGRSVPYRNQAGAFVFGPSGGGFLGLSGLAWAGIALAAFALGR